MVELHTQHLANIISMLERGVPTILIVGDNGVGKKTLVRQAAAQANIEKLSILEYPKLGIDDARSIKYLSIRAREWSKLCLIDGDYATEPAYNAMLKLLEEPPTKLHIVICASKPPLQTVVSRCSYVMIPPLTESELRQVLAFKGMSDRAISSVVPHARGSVAEALRVYEKLEEKRRLVPFVKALLDRDLGFVLTQVKTIAREDIVLMIELVDDLFLSRYGLLTNELSNLIPASPDFLAQVKAALLEGQSPTLAWLRAYFATNR